MLWKKVYQLRIVELNGAFYIQALVKVLWRKKMVWRFISDSNSSIGKVKVSRKRSNSATNYCAGSYSWVEHKVQDVEQTFLYEDNEHLLAKVKYESKRVGEVSDEERYDKLLSKAIRLDSERKTEEAEKLWEEIEKIKSLSHGNKYGYK